ncbi:MAG: D-lyxose/D-mannose family sugar isomerase [Calditrichaeota bacterium]|nr:D-lyxose/D-mannose family sugar isomerase [Calditrichota bacterium]RQW05768.1 MAG: D-lyxose/D-mannose family sugar isomerase [Calditrichota bacterium]
MKKDLVRNYQQKAHDMLRKAHIVITPEEKENIEVADFGLDDIENIGLQIVVYENNDRYCAKELVMLARQICPEHRHPPLSDQNRGKQETFRCRWGEVFLYVDGDPSPDVHANVPERYKPYLNVWHEIVLKPGEQYTLSPDTRHWFQAGDTGAVISEFSSTSSDETDIFTDPNIQRIPVVE